MPGETKESGFAIRSTSPRPLDVETIQVSIAHAYPGTEFYDYAKANGFIVNTAAMSDEGGHQMAHIEYPGLPTDYVLEMVHRFYDEYYFRPKAAFRVIWKAVVNRDVPRLYVEAKAFLKLRAQRNKMVKDSRSQKAADPPATVGARARNFVRVFFIKGGALRPPFSSFRLSGNHELEADVAYQTYPAAIFDPGFSRGVRSLG